jgi:hypothetical protein
MVVHALTVVVHTGGDDLATTILATLGVALSLLSLAWQFVSFRLSGSRVSVVLRSGMRDGSAVVTIPGTADPEHLKMVRAQGFTDPVLGVEVNNSGRSPTNIVSVSIVYPNGAAFTLTTVDPPLPFKLDAESEKTWYFSADEITTYARAMEQVFEGPAPLTVQGRAGIGGTGKFVVSDNTVTLELPKPTASTSG